MRFALYNRSGIENTPLQLYYSALLFVPETSIIRAKYKKHMPGGIQLKSKVQPGWSATLQTLEGHLSWVCSVAFSPDGQQIVSGSGDSTVRVWDACTGAALQTLKGHSSYVNSVAFSPDGQQIVSGSYDSIVRVWDACTGAALQMLKGHSSSVSSVAFSPDGQQIVSGSGDSTVRVWDAHTGAALQTLKGHSSSVSSVAFSPDGNISISVSQEWIAKRGERILWLPPDYRASCQAIWNDCVVLGHSSGRISIFEIKGSSM
jgi:WD40 repeat protein